MKQNYPRVGVMLISGGVRGGYVHTGFLLALVRTAVASCRCRGSAQEDELRVDINLSHFGYRIHGVQSGVTAKE